MGIFSKEYSIVKKTNLGKALIKLDERDLNKDGTYVLPKNITEISEHAFSGTSVRGVNIHDKCKYIGSNAFYSCENLMEIVIPEGVKYISPSTFEGCTNLKKVVLNNSVETIYSGAFKDCVSLTQIELPESLKLIGKDVFKGCVSLTNLKIPSSVTQISNAFEDCSSLRNVEINANIKTLQNCFSKLQSLQTIKLPEGLEVIGIMAFSECPNLKEVYIPNGVQEIASAAFASCSSLTNITLPESLETIGSAFKNCLSLESINIPKNVKNIEQSTFANCRNLSEVTLSEGLESIEAFAFKGCSALTGVILPITLQAIGEHAFSDSGITSIVVPENIESIHNVFSYCGSLKNIEIKARIDSLGDNCFWGCKQLEHVTLPETLTKISAGAFHETAIQEIYIPDNVETIEDSAFYGCTCLEQVKFPKNLRSIEVGAFNECLWLSEINLPEGLESIGNTVFKNCAELKEVNIPSSVNDIGQGVFAGCLNLESVTLPEGIKSLKSSLFFDCKNLKEVKIPETVVRVDRGVFAGTGITSMTFPKSVKLIDNCFGDCDQLKSVTIQGPAMVESSTFRSCTNLEVLNLPSGLTHNHAPDLSFCENLKEINYKNAKLKVDTALRDGFKDAIPFLDYAIENKKFIPKNSAVLTRTNPVEVQNFYAHAKDWQMVLNAYIKNFGESELGKAISDNEELYKQQLDVASEGLYQACTMLGLFQDGQNGKDAREFISKEVLKLEPYEIHEMFGALNTKDVGYNEEFAKFFIKNYEKPKEVDGEKQYFMHKQVVELSDLFENQINRGYVKNYIPFAYSSWFKVKEAYPNKTVLAHREQGSENNNLTFEDIVNALDTVRYENVKEGNETLAELVGKYGYIQEDFEILQNLFEEGKKVKDEVILSVKEDQAEEGIKYKLLSKDDPKGLVIGTLTNCCQELNNAGEACMRYGATAKNSGFIEFTYKDQTVGQSWVWYNEKTKQVCLDNIEVPTVWKKQISTEKGSKSFTDCLLRLANGFKQEMESRGHEVKDVSIGAGYNDVEAIKQFEIKATNRDILPDDYRGYSDATKVQYVVPIKEMKKETNSEEQIER